ncbi:MAG: DUF559 domain-containing protein [Planctomycetes bacterium]|nr:DUF559 domain-containing protein [Planctomycetota bacterium]
MPKNRALQERAKELRKQGILSEVIFWKTFKDKKKLGWDIDRQVIIGNFIVDFFIPELGLVFEIDGSSHNDKQEYDRERDAFLSSLRLKVVRILGKDVLGNIEGVWGFVTRLIKERVEELSPPRPSGTPQEGKRCEMQDSELGPIPKGWRVVSLADLMEFQGGSQPPADQFKDGYHEGYIRLIQIRDYETDSHITYVPRTDKLRICEDKDIMIARYGASVGRVLFGLNGAYNVALVKVIPEKKHYREFLRLYLKSYSFQERLLAMSSRSAQAGFNKGDFKSFRIAFPQGDQLLIEFEKITACLIEKILINNLESEALANTRDKLLPKLMSGEIEVRVMK